MTCEQHMVCDGGRCLFDDFEPFAELVMPAIRPSGTLRMRGDVSEFTAGRSILDVVPRSEYL